MIVSSGKESTELQAGGGNVLTLPPRPKVDLHDGHAIRRELATLYRDARAGRVDTRDATRLAYILDMLRKAYETCVLQDRLEQFEKTIEHDKE